MFEGKFFLSLKDIELPKTKSMPVFMNCKIELSRQHKLVVLLGLEVTISKSLRC